MDFNYFDLAVGVIVLLLGLKGILNGFFKELFGLIGIIGGIFIASRVGDETGQLLSDLIFKFENQAAISFTGFLVTLAAFWLLMVGTGILFKKLSTISGLGPVDRVMGFIFGSGKFFLIASVIVYALFNVEAIRKNLEPSMEHSMFFEPMLATGGFIMKIDPARLTGNDTVEEGAETAKEQIKEAAITIEKSASDAVAGQADAVIDEVRKQLDAAAAPKGNTP